VNHIKTVQYARNLLDAMGPKAELHAVRQVEKYQQADNPERAELWKNIRLAIAQRKTN